MASHLVLHEPNTREYEMSVLTRIQGKLCDKHVYKCTVESRYLELGYFEFCKTWSVYLNQKYILNVFSNCNLAFGTFFHVQIWTCEKVSPQLRDIKSWLYQCIYCMSATMLKVFKCFLKLVIYSASHQDSSLLAYDTLGALWAFSGFNWGCMQSSLMVLQNCL